MKKIRRSVANWCTNHHVPLWLYRWVCPKYDHVQCAHQQCQPCVANPVGMCLDGQIFKDRDGNFRTYHIPVLSVEGV